MNDFKQLLQNALKANQITLTETAQQQLCHYLALIQTWNNVFNLTAITDAQDMVYLHIIDSLIIDPYLKGERFLDVGTGAGLPGIPLAILNPQQQWVLLDKNNKKTRFLTQVIAELGLKNVTAVHARCEDFQPDLCFDTILSRAFASLCLFTTSTQHMLCKEGQWLAMKGRRPDDELSDLPNDFIIDDVISLKIKGMQVDRHLVKMRIK